MEKTTLTDTENRWGVTVEKGGCEEGEMGEGGDGGEVDLRW